MRKYKELITFFNWYLLRKNLKIKEANNPSKPEKIYAIGRNLISKVFKNNPFENV